MAPKVFVSHAREDKDRFVIRFAERLRKNGIDAWLDKWEMLPGDSLVDKIFEEGLKSAEAIVVVLSKHSVMKSWVREELNAGIVKRISDRTRLIPVVIDECEVPESLKSTVWERIADLEDYEESLNRVVAAIFDHRDKPALGSPPPYSETVSLPGLTKIDTLVLKLSCDHVIQTGEELVEPQKVFSSTDEQPSISEEQLLESLEILNNLGYIKLYKAFNLRFPRYQILSFGFETYARAYLPQYESLVQEVISAIINKDLHDNLGIVEALKQPKIIIDHVIDLLEMNGHIKTSKLMIGAAGPLVRIYYVSPGLRRILAG